MKNNVKYLFYLLLLCSLTSCHKKKYPEYSLTKISYVPDSLKAQQRTWITETVRAASQNMTGGDYEDVDNTVSQIEATANNLFTVTIIGLKKQIDEYYYNDIILMPNELNEYEKNIFDSLTNIR